MQHGSAAPQARLHIAEHSSGRGIGTLHDSGRQDALPRDREEPELLGFFAVSRLGDRRIGEFPRVPDQADTVGAAKYIPQ